jgi:hypothetical protein
MTWATAVVIIIALLVIGEIFKSKHRHRHGITTDAAGNEKIVERNDPALQREVEDLRERIKVLERIATEDRETKRLSAEIDALRSPTRLEEGSKQ